MTQSHIEMSSWIAALFILCFAVLQSADAQVAAARADRIQEFGKLVEPRVTAYETTLESDPDPSSRELAQYFHYALAMNRDVSKAEYAARKCFDAQEMDPKSPKFGTVPWKQNHPEINDPNAIEFTVHGVAPALVRYRDRLSPELRGYLQPHLAAGIAATRAHRVTIDYTNIYLMKATNLLLIGQYLSDESALSEGKEMLTTWLGAVKDHGITEYDSPTYASIVLNCLTPAHDLATDAQAKALLKASLDYTWTDLAANYFPGQQTLAGAQSRNYSFTSSVGILCNNYYLEGLRPAPGPMSLFNEGPDTYVNALEGGDDGYRPDAEILKLAQIPTRRISQRVGSAPGMDRTTFITPDFAVGSVSHWYGEQDRLINIQFASQKLLPDIVVIADEFDSPYGRVKRPDRAGHQKPVQLKRTVSITQHDGTVLALLNLVGAQNRELTSIATNVLLPLHADAIYVNDKPVMMAHPFEMPVPYDGVVLVREGKSAIAIRILHADSVTDLQAKLVLKCDPDETDVARLVAYHYSGGARTIPAIPIRAALLMKATTCATEEELRAFATAIREIKITDTSNPAQWNVTISAGPDNTVLSAGLGLADGSPSLRKINDVDVPTPAFMLNGTDMANKLLGSTGTAQHDEPRR